MHLMVVTLSPLLSHRASSIQVANMAQALAELDVRVTVVTPAEDRDPDTTGCAALFGFEPAFTLLPLFRRVHRGQSYPHALQVDRLVRSLGVDGILSRSVRASLLPALRGTPTVFEAHAVTSLRGTQDRWVLQRLVRARGLRGVVAISGALAADLVGDLGVDERRITVLHDGVRDVLETADHEREDDADVRGDATPFTVTYTGALYPGKGADLLLDVARLCPWAKFIIAGGPAPRADELRAWAQRKGIDNLDVTGPVDPAMARVLQRQSDVVVAPFSRRVESNSGVDISRWTSPLKVFEYMASGRPMIVGDLPVLHEVLRPEQDAIFTPLDDAEALAAAIRRLRENPDLCRSLSESARRRALGEFTWRHRAERVLALLTRDAGAGPAVLAP